jgi:hypothetical protein
MWSAAYHKKFFFSVKVGVVEVSIFVFHAVIDSEELIFLKLQIRKTAPNSTEFDLASRLVYGTRICHLIKKGSQQISLGCPFNIFYLKILLLIDSRP